MRSKDGDIDTRANKKGQKMALVFRYISIYAECLFFYLFFSNDLFFPTEIISVCGMGCGEL